MDGYKKTVFISIIGFCANLLLFILKIITGIASNSYAMIADALNSVSDILNSLMMFIGGKISQKPPSPRYPLGYGKAEYIFSVFISITMIIISALIFRSSFLSLLDSEHIEFSYYIVLCCTINIIIKFILYRYTRREEKKYNNILIKASCRDHRNDIFLALSTLTGGIFGYFGVWFVDGVVGICIALWIFFTGISLMKTSCAPLMDCDDNDVMRKDIINILNRMKDIRKVESVIILSASDRAEVRISLCVRWNMTVVQCSALKNCIYKSLADDKRVGRVILQINPYENQNLSVMK